MAILKHSLRLLEAVEQGSYEEALSLTKVTCEQEDNCFTCVAPDLIYKVAHSFGNQDNPQLKLLLIRLFELLTSAPQKYSICYELLTLRTSPLLTDVLVNQLGFLITDEFVETYPELWNQFCNELPLKLERRLCERMASFDEEIWFAIVEAAHVLAFFDKIPFRISYKFGRLIDVVLNEMASDEAAAYPFLIWYAREHPFSPKLFQVGHTEPTVLIPNVYDLRYLRLRLAEGICEYVNENEYRCDGAFVKPLANALRFLHKLCDDSQEIYATHIDIYAEMFVLLVRFIEDFDLEPYRFVIMKKSQDIIACFPMELRVLLLKRIIGRIISGSHLYLPNESKVLAWLLDQLKQNICEQIFIDELGSVFGLLENVTYEVPASVAYYSSILRIVKAYAHDDWENSNETFEKKKIRSSNLASSSVCNCLQNAVVHSQVNGRPLVQDFALLAPSLEALVTEKFYLLEDAIATIVSNIIGHIGGAMSLDPQTNNMVKKDKQRIFDANIPMLVETRERLVVRVRDELLDYLQCDLMNGKRAVQEEKGPFAQPLCSHQLSEEKSVKQLRAVLKYCEQTLADIDKVLSHSRQLH